MDNESKLILTKRFQTTMIGALFEFEKTFGYLWGHEKEEKDLEHSFTKMFALGLGLLFLGK